MSRSSSLLGARPWRVLLALSGVLVVAVGITAYIEVWWLALTLLTAALPLALLALRVVQRSHSALVSRLVDGLSGQVRDVATSQRSITDGFADITALSDTVVSTDALLRSAEWAAVPGRVRSLAGHRELEALSEKLDGATTNLARRIANAATTAARHNLSESQAVHQLMAKYRPSSALPEVDGWALSPSGLVWLLGAVEDARPSHVVECGSGTSTLWLAYALKQLGHGHVTALEHQPEFAEQTRRVLRRHGLEDWATVVDTPLSELDVDDQTFGWYRVQPEELGEVDMLLVDGPPTATGPHARFPALPRLEGVLSPGAVIVMDDTQRADEKEVIEAWTARYPHLERFDAHGNFLQAFRWNQG